MDNQVFRQHISQVFNKELEKLRAMLMEMGGLIESQVRNALEALLNNDSDLALKLNPVERRVNDIEMAIDRECTRILALRQPTASDLRMVLAIARATRDMERIGDEAIGIAKRAIKLSEDGRAIQGVHEVRNLGDHVRSMLNQTLDAFVRLDSILALKVVQEDQSVDLEYDSATRALMTFMMADPSRISNLLDLLAVLRALERIGDHATNIAEHLIFMAEGLDVRHLEASQLLALQEHWQARGAETTND